MSHLICGFIGLGLIGGSIARALKENVPNTKIIAYDVNREALSLAVKESVVDAAAGAIDETFSECDYIFLCAPVKRNDGNLTAVKKIRKPGCLLTDVGSVKTGIHLAVHEAGLDECFIGGHPMAGSERTGFLHHDTHSLRIRRKAGCLSGSGCRDACYPADSGLPEA